LSTIASGAPIFCAKKRARSTPPASGETTVKLGSFNSRKWPTSTGLAKIWSTGMLKSPESAPRASQQQGAIGSGSREQIGNELGADGHAGAVFAILAGVAVIRHNHRDPGAEAR